MPPELDLSSIVAIGPAGPAELALSLERAAETFEGSKVRRQLRADEAWRGQGSHCFVARSEGDVASSLFAIELPVYWPPAGGTPGGPLDRRLLLGVVSLLTPPQFQGRGMAGALLQWVQDWAAERRFVTCALFSEIGPEFYGRHGYKSLPLPFFRGPLSPPAAAGPPRALLGRPFTPADLPRVHEVYQAFASLYPLAICRDLEYWRRQLALLPFLEDLHSTGPTGRDFVVTSGEVVAYLRSRHDGDIFTVLELGWAPGSREQALVLLSQEMARAAAEGCLRASLHLPPGLAPPGRLPWKEVRRESFMIRPAAGSLADLDGYPCYVFRPDYF